MSAYRIWSLGVFAVFIGLIVYGGCIEKHPKHIRGEVLSVDTSSLSNVYIYDGCEYIIFDKGTSSQMMTHKGNCKNPIHYPNKQP